MEATEWVTRQFEADRSRLEGVAYRMLGSRTEAEDAVQEAWLRVARSDPAAIDNLSGWLTTVTGRICLDRLRARTSRREDLATGSIPEQTATDVGSDPEQSALLAESVGAALIVVLDSMAPEERVAFVLHDVFAVPFDIIGEILDRSSEAARQLASRGRRRVQGSRDVPSVDLVQHRSLVEAFLQAVRAGDFETLVRVLHPDVVLQPDEVAQHMGSRPVTRGAREVAAALSGGARGTRLVLANGLPALAWAPGGQIRSVIEFKIAEGRITAITVTADPERIAASDVVPLTEPRPRHGASDPGQGPIGQNPDRVRS